MAKPQRSHPIYVNRALIRSEAFLALTDKAPQVLFIFFTKRRVEKLRRPDKRGNTHRVTNNGELIFTYREAERTSGGSDGTP